jgi:hypothetical protein
MKLKLPVKINLKYNFPADLADNTQVIQKHPSMILPGLSVKHLAIQIYSSTSLLLLIPQAVVVRNK